MYGRYLISHISPLSIPGTPRPVVLPLGSSNSFRLDSTVGRAGPTLLSTAQVRNPVQNGCPSCILTPIHCRHPPPLHIFTFSASLCPLLPLWNALLLYYLVHCWSRSAGYLTLQQPFTHPPAGLSEPSDAAVRLSALVARPRPRPRPHLHPFTLHTNIISTLRSSIFSAAPFQRLQPSLTTT